METGVECQPRADNIVTFPNSLRARMEALENSGNLSPESIDALLMEYIQPLYQHATTLCAKLDAMVKKTNEEKH